MPTPLLASRGCVVALLGLALALPLHGQSYGAFARDSIRDDRAFTFYDRGPYRSGVPRPEQVLGYDVGSMNTQYAAQERTLLAIADAAKDRVRVEDFGSSTERRPMRIYIVSAPENIQRLDQIRADMDRLADPRGASAAELDAIVARTPAIVWINESVHGNESPGFETSMQTLYQLAASEEPATLAALKNAVVIINPSTNPDGHERFTVWYTSIGVGSPDPGSNEHREPWSIQGRYNHYRFDMNRDVMTATQREVQGLKRAMLRWHPMVAVDQHGQVTTYFFPPTANPMNENMGELAGKWFEILGRGNAAAFDRYGWMYFSRDTYDFYGPFYWDTWPTLQGGAGMTFETDGGGWKGLLWRREDGSLLSFRDGIAKHYVAAIATIETTAARREERVRDFLRFRQNAIADGRTGPMKRVVFLPGTDPARAAELAATLLRSGIEVRRASAGFASSRAHAYADDAVTARRFDTGAYVVDLAQPEGKVAKAFLEPSPALDPAFARSQVEKYRRNLRRGSSVDREGYEFYDVTAWSLPVTFGVEAYWTEDASPVTGDLLQLPAESPALPQAAQAPAATSVYAMDRLPVDVGGGVVGGARATTAYVFRPDRNGASRLAYHLLDEGYRVSVSAQPMEAGRQRFPRGTYVVRVARNDTSLHTRIDRLARESGVDVAGINTAFSEEQQFGVGSEPVTALVPPKIAMLGDDGVSQTGYGALWWSFERRYGIRFTPINLGYLAGGNISQFNVIIIPDASPGVLGGRLGKDGADRIREWVRSGGTLITMGGATAWAARENVNLTSARRVGSDTARDTTGIPRSPSADDSTQAQRRRERAPDRTLDDLLPVTSPSATNASPQPLPGTHFDVTLDRTHWLTFGYEQPRLTIMLDGDNFYRLSKDGANVAVFPATGLLHRAGFIWPDNTERLLRGTAAVIEEPVGAGHVILFANEPMFRGWWRAMDRLVLNGVILGPGF